MDSQGYLIKPQRRLCSVSTPSTTVQMGNRQGQAHVHRVFARPNIGHVFFVLALSATVASRKALLHAAVMAVI